MPVISARFIVLPSGANLHPHACPGRALSSRRAAALVCGTRDAPDVGRPGAPLIDDPLASGLRWRRAFLIALGVACLVIATSRFVDPVGERYAPYMTPGSAD